jgi:hypothetical protein
MKPRRRNAPRATPVAATSGANARQLGSGRVWVVQPAGSASHAARRSHRGAERRTDAGSQRVEAAGRVRPAPPRRPAGTTSAARQVAERHEGAPVLPLVGHGPPASVETQPSDKGFCTESTLPLPGSNQRVEQPSLALRRTAPAGGAKRGPPRSQGTPERARLIEPVMATNRTRLSEPVVRPCAGLGASRLTGRPGPPGRSTAPAARTRRPGCWRYGRGRVTRGCFKSHSHSLMVARFTVAR